ncbi:hypothetical protein DFH09DRAFT_1300362 [Mycena vulgaris]|nr:hypothetical protein DFH09DRAFT_1300362 [Mycena vulgaris]
MSAIGTAIPLHLFARSDSSDADDGSLAPTGLPPPPPTMTTYAPRRLGAQAQDTWVNMHATALSLSLLSFVLFHVPLPPPASFVLRLSSLRAPTPLPLLSFLVRPLHARVERVRRQHQQPVALMHALNTAPSADSVSMFLVHLGPKPLPLSPRDGKAW